MKRNHFKINLKQLQTPIPRKANTWQKNVQEYMINSTFHGLNYVGDTKLSITERFFFVLAFLLVSALSTYYISIMWLKWTATPLIITISPTVTPITDIPFPAVTVCNMNQARKSIAKDIKPMSFEEMQLNTLCMRRDENYKNKNHNFTSSWELYRKFLLRMSQPCDEMLVMCSFGSQPIRCSRAFETTLTDDGLCCTFNQVHPKFLQKNYRAEDNFFEDVENQPVDWEPELGYGTTVITNNIYPRVAPGPGSALGLTLVLYSNYEDYYCSSTNSAGFKLLLHNPIDTPLVANFGFLIRTGHHSRLAISPQIPSASPLIRSTPRHKRQCMFTSDANLTYFRSYTKRNCELECKSRTIEKECGCVLYYMPRLTENTKICSQEDAHCYEKTKLAIESSFNDTFVSCKCMPGCFSIFYKAGISMTKFNVNGHIQDAVLKNYNSSFLR